MNVNAESWMSGLAKFGKGKTGIYHFFVTVQNVLPSS